MTEFKKGDLIIINDLIGFCINDDGTEVTLNTTCGERVVHKLPSMVCLCTAQELACAYMSKIRQVIQ